MRQLRGFRLRRVLSTISFYFQCLTAAENTFFSALSACPSPCAGTPDIWTVYSAVDRLAHCHEPMLFDFAVHNMLDDPLTHTKIRACTIGDAAMPDVSSPANIESATSIFKKRVPSTPACVSATEVRAKLEFVDLGSNENHNSSMLVLLKGVENYFLDELACDSKLIFGYLGGVVVGVFTGVAIDNHATAPSVIQSLIGQVHAKGTTDMIIQLCGSGRTSDNTFGVVTATTGDLDSVLHLQKTVQSWSDGKCIDQSHTSSQKPDISVWEKVLTPEPSQASLTGRRLSYQGPQTDCTTVTVQSGDNCASLASKCSVPSSDFTKYNKKPNICAQLQPGQRVCCGAGSLPDIRPKKNSNGTCASYNVVADDNCSKIAAVNGISSTEIENFNNGTTWGWSGCRNIMVGTSICLSDGAPPMPAPVSNALCGPTKPGTQAPNATQTLSDLNPCPLNACCNVWGQCGIDLEFCTEARGPSNNPGTSPPGINGCIQNCGLNITNNDNGPDTPITVGYYESWNWDRPCLHLRAADLNTVTYTHLHWAFGTVNPDFSITINDSYNQFANFSSLPDVKKIISFGGWGASTDPATYDILRQAMLPVNADKFAKNISDFVLKYVDGVDFDWEYPGAPDIPGIPAGKESDGANYLAFLQKLRSQLPANYSISIAAPASYWYLKAFPIAEISKTVNYIVYMTYDLHGQWDYGSSWSNSGCPKGNCLRSHVNLTETMHALSMITKAGVPSNKVTVGVSSYGRSFKMSESTCSGPECTFIGPESSAATGMCTETAGILGNAEIDTIISLFPNSSTTHYDSLSSSDILIYGGTEWVSYLSETNKRNRKMTYKMLNFAGTADWAVDLQSFDYDTADSISRDSEDDDSDEQSYTGPPLPVCSETYTSFEEIDSDADDMPSNCRALYAVQALDALLTEALANYTIIMDDGYDEKFDTYAGSVVDSASKNVEDFYTGNGNKYFTCSVLEFSMCCSDCRKSYGADDPFCKYCFDGSCTKKRDALVSIDADKKGNNRFETGLAIRENVVTVQDGGEAGQPKHIINYVNTSEPCPPDYSLRGSNGPEYKETVYWSLVSDKADSFWSDLLNETGITSDNIAFKNIQNYPCGGYSDDECINVGAWAMNVPTPQGYDKSDIANPKDVVTKALENVQKLGPQIKDLLLNIRTDSYQGGDPLDAVDALGIPVTMIADAVENMASVAAIGEEIDEAKKKAKRNEILFGFLTAILIFIPVAGEVLGTISSVATIGRIVALVGNLGNVAFDTYTIVKDPENAPLAIFGLILAPLGLTDVVAITKAARIARGMDSGNVAKLGAGIGKRLTSLQKVTKMCKK